MALRLSLVTDLNSTLRMQVRVSVQFVICFVFRDAILQTTQHMLNADCCCGAALFSTRTSNRTQLVRILPKLRPPASIPRRFCWKIRDIKFHTCANF